MERKYLKAIKFDLSVHELQKYYPDYRKAYYDVKKFFVRQSFLRRNKVLIKQWDQTDLGNRREKTPVSFFIAEKATP